MLRSLFFAAENFVPLYMNPLSMQSLYSQNLRLEEHLHCFIICRWQEALTVYPRTNKQNQKKKRKVDPPTHQVMNLFFLCPVNNSQI